MNRRELELTFGRRFARLATNAVLARPGLWRVFRPLLQAQFDRLAPGWDDLRRPEAFAALEQALAAVPGEPKRVLDLGTGTGAAAYEAARRFPSADVVGVDVAEQMLAQARAKTPSELDGRVTFQAADAARLPFEEGSFDLVLLANMIPFFDELARVVAPGGHVLFSFSGGSETPIWVPPERLRNELSARGFADFAGFEAAGATAMLARRSDRT